MKIDLCPHNIRCDTAGCFSYAKYNINTASYKGSICLCDKCLNELHQSINQIKKSLKNKEK